MIDWRPAPPCSVSVRRPIPRERRAPQHRRLHALRPMSLWPRAGAGRHLPPAPRTRSRDRVQDFLFIRALLGELLRGSGRPAPPARVRSPTSTSSATMPRTIASRSLRWRRRGACAPAVATSPRIDRLGQLATARPSRCAESGTYRTASRSLVALHGTCHSRSASRRVRSSRSVAGTSPRPCFALLLRASTATSD